MVDACRTTPIWGGDINSDFGIRQSTSTHDGLPPSPDPADPLIGAFSGDVERLPASAIRDVLKVNHMCVLNTFYNGDPTFYGCNHTSRVDHLFVPRAFLPCVRSCYTSRGLGSRLQMVRSCREVDHRPVCFLFDYVLETPHMEPTPGPIPDPVKWNKDFLMKAVSWGYNKPEFLQKLEEHIETLNWNCLYIGNPTPAWTQLNDAIKHVAEKFFTGRDTDADHQYTAIRDERMLLIRDRATLRTELGASTDQSAFFLAICARLGDKSAQLRTLRRRFFRERGKQLDDEITQAWKQKHFAEVFRLARIRAGRQLGTKKRRYNQPGGFRADMDTTSAFFSQPAAEGGIAGEPVDIADKLSEVQSNAWITSMPHLSADTWDLVNSDYQGLRKYVKYAKKRRAAPPWSVPLELWHMILHPFARCRDSHRFSGVGVEKRDGFCRPVCRVVSSAFWS